MSTSPESSQATCELAGKVMPKPSVLAATARLQLVRVVVPGSTHCVVPGLFSAGQMVWVRSTSRVTVPAVACANWKVPWPPTRLTALPPTQPLGLSVT